MMQAEEILDYKTFISLIDQAYDEIFIWNQNCKVVYANNACFRHYGYPPQYFIGKSLEECLLKEKHWDRTSIHYVFQEKKSIIQKQKTSLGHVIVTISVPIFDILGNVTYVVQTIRDDYEHLYRTLSPYVEGKNECSILREDNSNNVCFIGINQQIKKILECSKRLAQTSASVLILGETGTGKSLLAKYIHIIGNKSHKPFVSINIASLSPTLIESELFGYKEGSFTGSSRTGKKGFFEIANGGTIFLDEIGEIPLALQAKFLHVLEEKEILPVGGSKPIKLDIKIISATNRDLQQMVTAGKFREDLYHRLNVFELTIPPLRSRPDDLTLFVEHFLKIFNKKYDMVSIVSQETMGVFLGYEWPGNIRELSNVIERCVVTSGDGIIRPKDLPASFFKYDYVQDSRHIFDEPFDVFIAKHEKYLVEQAYQKYKSSRKLADVLKISQTKASRLIKKYVHS